MKRIRKRSKQGHLYNKVLYLLKNRPRGVRYEDIAKETGLCRVWIQALVCQRINDPSVNKIEILYKYLTGKELNVE